MPSLIMLHYTAMAGAEAARDWLCNPEAQVSAHYVLGRDGTLWQLVDEAARAWHAGAGAWADCSDVNSQSIGIEIANTGLEPFPEPQMRALVALLKGVTARWGIPSRGVIAHSDSAPGRKQDPGRRMDWRRLAMEGVAIWPDAVPQSQAPAPERFLRHAGHFGYACDAVPFDTLLEAFRQRFRPMAHGPLEAQDMDIIAALAQRWPSGQSS